ncbi:MAG: formyltransferase family protein [Edaphocola sp.]
MNKNDLSARMPPVRIVFLGSKPIGYQCLQYLVENAQGLNIAIVAMRTQVRKEFEGNNDLSTLAQAHHIPILNSLDDLPECDIIYSVQHHELLRERHIEKATKIAANLHLAPLPEYRGCNQFSFAIMDEAKEFGATIHEIDTRIDHGDVLFETRFAIPENCWVNQLHGLTNSAGLQLFKDTIPNLIMGNYQKTPQQLLKQQRPEHLHYRHEIAQLKNIDLNQPAQHIAKTIRATYMPGFEPPFTLIDGRKFYFSENRHGQ